MPFAVRALYLEQLCYAVPHVSLLLHVGIKNPGNENDRSPYKPMNSIVTQCVLLLFRTYKRVVSPWMPPACRYVPTCSEYAMEAVACYGVLRGSWMTFARLLRCHPFVKGGYDPVPCKVHHASREDRETEHRDRRVAARFSP